MNNDWSYYVWEKFRPTNTDFQYLTLSSRVCLLEVISGRCPPLQGCKHFRHKMKCHRQTYNTLAILFFLFCCARITPENSGLNTAKSTDCFLFPNAHSRCPAEISSALIYHSELNLFMEHQQRPAQICFCGCRRHCTKENDLNFH